MFVPLSDTQPCNRFVGTATYERLEAGIEATFEAAMERGYFTDEDLTFLFNDHPIHFNITFEEEF